jgi:hypothetical protein
MTVSCGCPLQLEHRIGGLIWALLANGGAGQSAGIGRGVTLRLESPAQFLDTFKEFPPRHEPASFSIDQIVKKLEQFLAAD